MKRRRIICNAISIISIFAMIWIGLAHRSVINPTATSNIDLAAYTLPDGSIPVICLANDGERDHGSQKGCPDCTIANSIIIPQRSEIDAISIVAVDITIKPRRKFTLSNTIQLASAPPTGPPKTSL
jgi:hypothetical protein